MKHFVAEVAFTVHNQLCEAAGNRFAAAILDGIGSELGSQCGCYNKSSSDQLSRMLVEGFNNSGPALHVLFKSQSKMLPGII